MLSVTSVVLLLNVRLRGLFFEERGCDISKKKVEGLLGGASTKRRVMEGSNRGRKFH